MKPTDAAFAVVAVTAASLIPPHVTAARKFSDWAAPTNLGCQINSPSGEQGPAISKNGLSLYFGSNRPGGFGATTSGSRSAPQGAIHGDHR